MRELGVIIMMECDDCDLPCIQDWYEDIVRMLSQKPGQRHKDKIMAEFRQMYADLMDRAGPSEDDLYDSQPETASSQAIPNRVAMGRYRRRFAEVSLSQD